jgi:hypothetical protein
MKTKHFVVWMAILSFLAMSSLALAEEKGQGGMSGMKMEDQGGMKMGDQGTMQGQGMQGHGMTHGGNDMMSMGTRAYGGKMGSWHSEARMIDMKAQMESSGMKAQGTMTNSHHIALSLTDPKTKKPVTEGTGTVTVVGPDKSMKTYNVTGMKGHFGADVNLPKPGKYRCNVKMESGGKTGTATFHYTLK